MRRFFPIPVLASLILLAGCRGPEVVIANPLGAGTVEPNHITHPAKWAEGESGLASGTLADEAKLVSADERRVCFEVISRVPAEALLDLARVSAVMRVSGGGGGVGTQATVKAGPPSTKSFDGQVAQRTQVGTTRTCLISDPNTGVCRTWDEQAKMGTEYVPGKVRVREQSAEICFANTNLLSAQSEDVVLELSQDGHRFGRYRWGFAARH